MVMEEVRSEIAKTPGNKRKGGKREDQLVQGYSLLEQNK